MLPRLQRPFSSWPVLLFSGKGVCMAAGGFSWASLSSEVTFSFVPRPFLPVTLHDIIATSPPRPHHPLFWSLYSTYSLGGIGLSAPLTCYLCLSTQVAKQCCPQDGCSVTVRRALLCDACLLDCREVVCSMRLSSL